MGGPTGGASEKCVRKAPRLCRPGSQLKETLQERKARLNTEGGSPGRERTMRKRQEEETMQVKIMGSERLSRAEVFSYNSPFAHWSSLSQPCPEP